VERVKGVEGAEEIDAVPRVVVVAAAPPRIMAGSLT
jgi:hypothetical protein